MLCTRLPQRLSMSRWRIWIRVCALAIFATIPLQVFSTQAQDLFLSKGQITSGERARLQEEARSSWAEAQGHLRAGKLDEAIAAAERVLPAMRRLDASLHPEFVVVLTSVADWQERRARFDEARKSRTELLEVQERLRGPDHWQAIDARQDLARLEKLKSLSAEELQGYYDGRARAWEVLRLDAQSKYADAALVAQAVADVYKRTVGNADPQYALSLRSLAEMRYRVGEFSVAEPLAREALAITKASLGETHPYYAASLGQLAKLLEQKGDFAGAEQFFHHAIAVSKTSGGEGQPDHATVLQNLAELYRGREDYARAEPLYRQALEILRKNKRETDPGYGIVLHNSALVHQGMGDYARAETLERQALEALKKSVGEMHAAYAASLNGLAGIHYAMGDLARAEPAYRQALEIRRRTLGESHPAYALTLNNLGTLYQRLGDNARAEKNFREALEIRRRALGETHPDVANSMHNLAGLSRDRGDHAQADVLLRQALEAVKKSVGDEGSEYASHLNSLGLNFHMRGDYAAAEPLYRQAVEIQKKALGEMHPAFAEATHNLGALYFCQGNSTEAEPLLTQALNIARKNLNLSSQAQSERQQITMTLSLRRYLDSYLTLAVANPQCHSSAYAHLFAWKGMVARRQRSFRDSLQDPRLKAQFEELESVARDLARQAFGAPSGGQRDAWRTVVHELSERKERLEADLMRTSAEFRAAASEATVAELQAALGDNVLVDCFEYQHWRADKAARGGRVDENRLAAFIIRRDGDAVLLELGPAAPLYESAGAWRAGCGATPASIEAGRRLRAAVWDKLEPHLAASAYVLISPDGPLHWLPLAALPGTKPGSYLIEEWKIAVIPSPHALAVRVSSSPTSEKSTDKAASSGGKLLILGDIDYNAELAASPSAQKPPSPPKANDRFAPVEGARSDVALIKDAYQKAHASTAITTLTASAATEDAFRRQAPQHQYLHLDTHGFFAPADIRSALSRSTAGEAPLQAALGTGQALAGYHPNLLSGIVLAGVNRAQPAGADDGILTAEEVQSLDLRGVELAVLSACETGLGLQAGGEGLLGLQRAFQVAGAKTVVASLWKVPSVATHEMLDRFYANLWTKRMGKLAALREAQLWMLRQRGGDGLLKASSKAEIPPQFEKRLPPFFWAGFVLSGDWR